MERYKSSDYWELWEFPRADCEYCVGADVAEGTLLNPNDERSEADFNAAVVLNRNTGLIAAVYHGRDDPDKFGVQCLLASRFYNNAWSSPEVNSAGLVVLNIYKKAGYQNLYQRQKHDDQWVETDAPQLGWRTTALTRRWLIESLRNAARDNAVKILSLKLIEEMRAFIYDKDGEARHQAGRHDDIIFALGIALQLHQRCPLNSQPYGFGWTGLGASHPVDKERPKAAVPAYYIGGSDGGLLTENEDEGRFTV